MASSTIAVVDSVQSAAVSMKQLIGSHDETKAEERNYQFSSEPLPESPSFSDKYEEREYQKKRLALAFRIFAKCGFDEGVAGHITLRVSLFVLL